MLMIKDKRLGSVIRYSVPLFIVPALAVLGALVLDSGKHLIVSLTAAALSLLLFAAGFDKKKIGTRRMVICAVMTALAFAGRFIPFLNPITAMAIITGVYMGCEAGFLVGSLAALLSNFYFGQGPWTVFQMLAWGLIGFFAGVLAKPLKSNTPLLLMYGAFCGVAYSFIMDIWTVLWYNKGFSWGLYLSALATAVPYTVSYAVSNVIFLLLLFKPFGVKLERVRTKYGI